MPTFIYNLISFKSWAKVSAHIITQSKHASMYELYFDAEE